MKPTIGNPDIALQLGRINLNHLFYFWAVARAGSVTAASRTIGISQSSISEQLRTLEQRLGAPLLQRTSRGVRLTTAGERARRYAEEIVGICGEMVVTLPLKGVPEARPLRVGTADAVPKIVVRSLLRPILDATPGQRVECREWRVDQLLAELTLHRLDLVLTDAPVDADLNPRLTSLAAGVSSITVCAAPALARKLRSNFPASMDGVPFLLPSVPSPLRQSMERWFSLCRITPRIVIEADDRSQLNHFAEVGYGVVPVPSIITKDIGRQFGLVEIGMPRGVREEYFACVVHRGDQHPSVALMRDRLMRGEGPSPPRRTRTTRSRKQTKVRARVAP